MRSHDSAVRSRSFSVLCAIVGISALIVSITPGSAAAAGGSGAPAATTAPACPPAPAHPTTADAAPDLLPGVKIGPALVVTPGKPNRHLNADQATAFIQSWLPSSIYLHLPAVKPPVGVPVSKLYMTTTYAGVGTCITAWYAAQGTSAWVGMPAQSLGWASVQHDTWIAAPIEQRTIAAFAGHVKPIAESAPPTTTTTPAKSPDKAAGTGGSSSSSTALWIVIPVIVILAGLGVWLLVKSRGRANVA